MNKQEIKEFHAFQAMYNKWQACWTKAVLCELGARRSLFPQRYVSQTQSCPKPDLTFFRKFTMKQSHRTPLQGIRWQMFEWFEHTI